MNAKNHDKLSDLLSAYLDDELSAGEKAQVEQWLRTDESARRSFQELRATVGMVSSLPRRVAPRSIAEDLQVRLERHDLLGEVSDYLPTRRSRWPFVRTVVSIAAVLGVVVVAGLYIAHDGDLEPALLDVRHAVARRESSPDDAALHAPREGKVTRRSARGSSESAQTKTKVSLADTERVVTRDNARLARRRTDRAAKTADASDRVATSRGRLGSLGYMTAVEKHPPASPAMGSSERERLTGGPPPRDALILAVTVHSEDARNALIDTLAVRFADALVEATAPPRLSQTASRDAAPRRAGEVKPERRRRSRRKSRSGASAQHRPVTLRVALRSLPALVTEIDARLEYGDMTLEAGPLHVAGRNRVRRMIEVIASPPTPSTDSGIDRDTNKATGLFGKTWRDLLTAIGVAPAVVASLAEPRDVPPPQGGSDRSVAGEPLAGPRDPTERYADATEPSESDLTRPKSSPAPFDEGDTIGQPYKGGSSTNGVPEDVDARSSLVDRRMNALMRERVDEEPAAGSVTESETGERSTDLNTRRVVRTTPTETGGDRPPNDGEVAIDSSTEQFITLIVRIDVDPSLGPVVDMNPPSRAQNTGDARQPPAPPRPVHPTTPTKPRPAKPARRDTREKNKSGSSSLKY